jgi:ubiquitin C-terminal hydrolase
VSGYKATTVQENQEQLFEPSLIRDIFGGVTQTEFHIEGTKNVSTTHEPFFVINLEIPKFTTNLQTCLESYFKDKYISDYEKNGRRVSAWHKQLITKLPNVLCL